MAVTKRTFLWAGAIVAMLASVIVYSYLHYFAGNRSELGQQSSAVSSVHLTEPISVPGLSSKMIYIGEARMDFTRHYHDGREPAEYIADIKGFWLDATEVTVGDYLLCVKANACVATATINRSGYPSIDSTVWSSLCNLGRTGREKHPMNCIDWTEASHFCKWANKRLPTEDEWEYAAAGVEKRKYPWGNDAPNAKRVNACGQECSLFAKEHGRRWPPLYSDDDGWSDTAPVGSYQLGKTELGLFDMAGNVWEWTSTVYWSEFFEPDEIHHIVKGGGWSESSAEGLTTFIRAHDKIEYRYFNLGFRCAR